jgi:hypothetical protein
MASRAGKGYSPSAMIFLTTSRLGKQLRTVLLSLTRTASETEAIRYDLNAGMTFLRLADPNNLPVANEQLAREVVFLDYIDREPRL